MRENNLLCNAFDQYPNNNSNMKYNSYEGTIGLTYKNKIHHKFTTDRPYQKIVTDVTKLRWGNKITNERAYFTAFVDIFSNEIISWNIELDPTIEFVTRALDKLISEQPKLKYRMTIHSDQGYQYQCHEYTSKLKKNHIVQSMNRKTQCLDNAVMESVFHILKVSTVNNNIYKSYEELKQSVTNFVDYYNNYRIRTKLNGKTPVAYD